ncbi:MAG: hypothetical protein A2252_09245 [Elusimicrobia bacterium RIFOXYA2_FULL_39_19]|nr:MAG: hypothetical protein A2252_09245 [Elusimicrobia bacterium RIFOXYA2_FULL_39_19]
MVETKNKFSRKKLSAAAHQYRLQQARVLLNSFAAELTDGKSTWTGPAFCEIKNDSFLPIKEILTNPKYKGIKAKVLKEEFIHESVTDLEKVKFVRLF